MILSYRVDRIGNITGIIMHLRTVIRIDLLDFELKAQQDEMLVDLQFYPI